VRSCVWPQRDASGGMPVAGTAGLLPALEHCRPLPRALEQTPHLEKDRRPPTIARWSCRASGPATFCGSARRSQRAGSVHGHRPDQGYDDRNKISERKCFGIVDALGLVVAVVALPASTSDNVGGAAVFGDAAPKSKPLEHLFCDGGLKNSFAETLEARQVVAEVVNKIQPGRFEIQPKR